MKTFAFNGIVGGYADDAYMAVLKNQTHYSDGKGNDEI